MKSKMCLLDNLKISYFDSCQLNFFLTCKYQFFCALPIIKKKRISKKLKHLIYLYYLIN